MILTVLADDFTGALDTGVQFAAKGIRTYVAFHGDSAFEKECEVLVIDMQSRHLPPQQAYTLAFHLARRARESGAVWLYKKTDSTLRGNIGAELEGALRGFGETRICFAPAYPKLGRKTVQGVQYVQDKLLTETSYAADALNPVVSSKVDEIIHTQSHLPVSSQWETLQEEGIFVADARTDEDLARTAASMCGKTRVFAGCAGFAEYLDAVIPLSKGNIAPPPNMNKLLLVSGSIHPNSLSQIDAARREGFAVYSLSTEEKLLCCSENGSLSRQLAQKAAQSVKREGIAVVAADITRADVENFDHAAQRAGISHGEAARHISRALGELCRCVTEMVPDAAVMVFGGDTAAAVLKAYGASGIYPLCQLCEGVPICSLEDQTGTCRLLVTKAGGFVLAPGILSGFRKETGRTCDPGRED